MSYKNRTKSTGHSYLEKVYFLDQNGWYPESFALSLIKKWAFKINSYWGEKKISFILRQVMQS